MIGKHRNSLAGTSCGYDELDAMASVLGEDPELECARERLAEPYEEPQHGDTVVIPVPSDSYFMWDPDGRTDPTMTIRRVTFRRELFSLPTGDEFWAWVAEKDGKVYL